MDAFLPEVHETVVDGVRVRWAPAEGPVTVGLVFDGGMCVEPVHLRGIQHTIEHLVLSQLGRRLDDYNGSVAIRTTTFFASGEPDGVAEIMRTVCEGLADLPVDRHETEPGVIQAEAAQRGGGSTFTKLLNDRFGSVGPGVLDVPELSVGAIPADVLRRWAAERMHTGRAALWATADPSFLDLSALPAGETADPWALPPQRAGASWTPGNQGGFAAVAVLERSTSLSAMAEVLREHLMDDLRTELGVAYEVAVPTGPLTGTESTVGLFVDGAPDRLVDLRDALLSSLDRFVTDGPSPDLAQHVLERSARAMRAPGAAVNLAVGQVDDLLLGMPEHVTAEVFQRYLETTPEQMRVAAQAFLDDAQWMMPDAAAMPPWRQMPRHQPWSTEVVDGRTVWPTKPLDYELKVGGEGLSLIAGPERLVTVRFEDAVAMEAWDDGLRVLHGRDGRAVAYDPELHTETAEFVAWLDQRVPAELILQRGPRPPRDGS